VTAMQQITDWLKKLGLSEYVQCFVQNGISLAALPHLTDADLKEIGVLLGHRRIMLAAISELTSAAEPVTSQPAAPRAEPRDDAERRQLTVMFTDLVGSTALSTKLDPEDLRYVIGVYHKCVAETVARFDGFVAKYMGDGVLVYFGYPQAHEDDAERAVRTGLALTEAVGKVRAQEPLQVRIGVATGLVVVGDLVGSGEAQERGVVGETPNLAARLQGIAAPNMVVIADGTRRLLAEDGRIPRPRGRVGAAERDPRGAVDEERPEDVFHPGELVQRRTAEPDEDAAQHEGEQDPEQQDAAVVLACHPGTADQQDEHQEVVE